MYAIAVQGIYAMRNPFKKSEPVTEDRTYTSLVTADIEAAARGHTIPSVFQLAANVISSAFAVARVTVQGADLYELNSVQLANIGRELVLSGESLYTEYGGELRDVKDYEILSNGAYRVHVVGTKKPLVRNANKVLHIRFWMDKNTLRGVSLSSTIPIIRDTLLRMENAFYAEAGTPTGYLLPVPADGDEETLAGLRKVLSDLDGRLALVRSTRSGWDTGREHAPRREFEPQRLGMNFSTDNREMYKELNQYVLAMFGVPVDIVYGGQDGGQRESWRRFLHGTVNPLGLRIVDAYSDIGIPAHISFEDLFASDITGRARAFGSLVQGGMDIEQAAMVTGVIQDE